MGRARNPDREKAKELWLNAPPGTLLKDIASQLGLQENTIRKWKCEDHWEAERSGKKKRNAPKKKKKMGAPKGNTNAVGHGAPVGNQNAFKHGGYAAILFDTLDEDEQGVGKTGTEAAVVLWFLTCFPYPRVVCTAPTKQQLHDVLWSEISKWQSNSPILSDILKWTKTYIYMVGYEKRWFAVARTATKPENMQGFHEDNMLFVVDEASGVADPIMEAILGTLSGENNKLLLCGNPTKTSGAFYDAFHSSRAIYSCHTVNSE